MKCLHGIRKCLHGIRDSGHGAGRCARRVAGEAAAESRVLARPGLGRNAAAEEEAEGGEEEGLGCRGAAAARRTRRPRGLPFPGRRGALLYWSVWSGLL